MFSAELKERTAPLHAALEKKLVTRIRQIGNTDDYVRLLHMMYGFYFPLQSELQSFTGSVPGMGPRRGRQAELILKDIGQLTAAAPVMGAVCTQLPRVAREADALGVLYVLEGSTLGGRIIAGMIARQLGISDGRGFAFFDAYGEATVPMWQQFRSWLDQPRPDGDKQAIIQSANDTFSSFKIWIDDYESRTHQ